MVGEYGSRLSRVTSARLPSGSCMRIALTASNAAWLLPTTRYWACTMVSSIAFVDPDRFGRRGAAQQRLGLFDDPVEMLHRDISPGESADEARRRDGAAEPVKRALRLLEHRSAVPAESDGTVDHPHRLDPGQRRHQRLDRERAKGLDLDDPDALPGRALLIHRILGGAGHAAERHQRELGVFHAVFLDQRREGPTEACGVF